MATIWSELSSSCCKECLNNVTDLHGNNIVCVHCTHVEFSKEDMFIRRNPDIIQSIETDFRSGLEKSFPLKRRTSKKKGED